MCSIQTMFENSTFWDTILCRWIGSNIAEERTASIFKIMFWPKDRCSGFSENWYLSAQLQGVASHNTSRSLV
jgi:hypothetical protein